MQEQRLQNKLQFVESLKIEQSFREAASKSSQQRQNFSNITSPILKSMQVNQVNTTDFSNMTEHQEKISKLEKSTQNLSRDLERDFKQFQSNIQELQNLQNLMPLYQGSDLKNQGKNQYNDSFFRESNMTSESQNLTQLQQFITNPLTQPLSVQTATQGFSQNLNLNLPSFSLNNSNNYENNAQDSFVILPASINSQQTENINANMFLSLGNSNNYQSFSEQKPNIALQQNLINESHSQNIKNQGPNTNIFINMSGNSRPDYSRNNQNIKISQSQLAVTENLNKLNQQLDCSKTKKNKKLGPTKTLFTQKNEDQVEDMVPEDDDLYRKRKIPATSSLYLGSGALTMISSLKKDDLKPNEEINNSNWRSQIKQSIQGETQTETFKERRKELIAKLRDCMDDKQTLVHAKPKRNHSNVNQEGFRGSMFRGVSKNKNKWQMMIMGNFKKMYVGAIDQEQDAAQLYDKVAIFTHGLKAKTNFSYNRGEILQFLTREDVFADPQSSQVLLNLINKNSISFDLEHPQSQFVNQQQNIVNRTVDNCFVVPQ
eukprot:403354863